MSTVTVAPGKPINRQRTQTGPSKSMAERINERLAKINASRVVNNQMENDPEDYSRPFTPTDHALTARPRLEDLGLFKAARSIEPIMNHDNANEEDTKMNKTNHFKQFFPKPYVEVRVRKGGKG